MDPGFLEHVRLSPRAIIGPGARFLEFLLTEPHADDTTQKEEQMELSGNHFRRQAFGRGTRPTAFDLPNISEEFGTERGARRAAGICRPSINDLVLQEMLRQPTEENSM